MKRTAWIRIVLIAALLPACGGGDDDDTTPPPNDSAPRDMNASDSPGTPDAPAADAPPDDGGSPDDGGVLTDGGSSDAGMASDGGMATGDTCATADAITAGTLMAQTNVGYANDYAGLDCTGFNTDGPDHVYAIVVPAGQQLTATATPTDFDAALYLITPIDACTAPAPTCVAGSDNAALGEAETATYTNATGADVTVYVVVDGYLTGAGTYDLTTAVAAPAAGDLCSNATPIVSGTPLTGETTVGFLNDYAGTTLCTTFSIDGPDHVYSIDVPTGATLTATLTPEMTFDAAVYLITPIASCTSVPTCVAGADVGLGGDPETATYTNTDPATATVYIVVDGYSSTTEGTFDLAADVVLP